MSGHRVSGKADYMMDNRHKTSQSGQILTRQLGLLNPPVAKKNPLTKIF